MSTPVTPAVPEPVAWIDQVIGFFVEHDMLDQRDEYSLDDVMGALRDNYEPSDAAQMQALADRLAECEAERDYWKTEAQGETAKVQYRDKLVATIEAAQAAVQADYDRRILSALQEPATANASHRLHELHRNKTTQEGA